MAAIGWIGIGVAWSGEQPTGLTIAPDHSGYIGTYSTSGPDSKNAFFQSLGTNGRSCSTCHLAGQAMSFTPAHARRLYDASHGTDPLFASIDGANCSGVAPQDRDGHSLVLALSPRQKGELVAFLNTL